MLLRLPRQPASIYGAKRYLPRYASVIELIEEAATSDMIDAGRDTRSHYQARWRLGRGLSASALYFMLGQRWGLHFARCQCGGA